MTPDELTALGQGAVPADRRHCAQTQITKPTRDTKLSERGGRGSAGKQEPRPCEKKAAVWTGFVSEISHFALSQEITVKFM